MLTDNIKNFSLHQTDTGSPAVQILVTSAKIEKITGHLKYHRKDYHSRRGLIAMVNQRKKMLLYLYKKNRVLHGQILHEIKRKK